MGKCNCIRPFAKITGWCGTGTGEKCVPLDIRDPDARIYIVDRGWYSLLNNECRSDDYDTIGVTVNRLMADIKNDSLPVLEHKQKLFAVRFRDFILEKDMRHEEVFGEVKMSYADVITHVVNHGTYHRGNITAMLHQLGHKGVPTDYGRYLYEIAL
jgi:uncharacterized damage-inducible protein DinB